MNRKQFITTFFSLTLILSALYGQPALYDIIPRPLHIIPSEGYYEGTLEEILDEIIYRRKASGEREEYTLKVSCDSVIVEAVADAGEFYAVQTIKQLYIDGKGVPSVEITDIPRFEWRGMMLDISRHFFDKEYIKKQIDAMAAMKMNKLHLHLTDAAGWRLEIDSYPLLTGMAAWRSGDTWKEWWFGDRLYLEEGAKGAYGGYLTKKDAAEIVEYAAERHIAVIPEIEMPGHSEEVLAVYPELSCTGIPYKHGDFCAGKEEVFVFIEKVLKEVMDIFPSEYIHIGGDEASKASWKECPYCADRMKAHGLNDLEELQAYFVKRVEKFLAEHGRKMIGWDEILSGGGPDAQEHGSAVMVWRGRDMARSACDKGIPTILAPGGYCYFDTYQDNPALLPPAMGGYVPLERVYSFYPEEWCDESSILGVQSTLFAEYVSEESQAEMMLYPRVMAIAEIGWSPAFRRDYQDFRRRAAAMCEKMRKSGYSTFDLKNEYGQRREYLTPVDHLAKGRPVRYNAGYYPGYSAGGDSALVDGLRGGWIYNDGRWQGFISKGDFDVIIDLGEIREVREVSADFMQMCGPDVYLPEAVEISISEEGKEYVGIAELAHEVVRDEKPSYKTFAWKSDTPVRARYVRYRAIRSAFRGFLFTDEVVVR